MNTKRLLGFLCVSLSMLALPAAAQTTVCQMIQDVSDLVGPGQVIDHKTDFTESMGEISGVDQCTYQMTVKVDKSGAPLTKVDFKIDQSCDMSGQAQVVVISLDLNNDPVCHVDYDNPLDPMVVGSDDVVANASVGFIDLILNAADATAIPPTSMFASDLVGVLNAAAQPTAAVCPCWADVGNLSFLRLGWSGSNKQLHHQRFRCRCR